MHPLLKASESFYPGACFGFSATECHNVYIPKSAALNVFNNSNSYFWCEKGHLAGLQKFSGNLHQALEHASRCFIIFVVRPIIDTLVVGEPFTQEEMEEMLSAALNPDTGQIVCKDFVPMMLVEENS